MSSVFAV